MLKRTPLYDWHKKHNAKFTDFGGWELLVLYTSIVPEHMAVRQSVGLFDISHMGQILVEGNNALEFLQKICTNDISKCRIGAAAYSHMCNEQGGVIDDIFVYCLSATRYLVVVNAATRDKDFNWLTKNNSFGLKLTHLSDQMGMMAIQGPNSEKVLSKIFQNLPLRNQCFEMDFMNSKIFLCRTGYTGEDGFEIIAPKNLVLSIWESCMEKGQEFKIVPIGLGARDTLRLESGFLLYGSDVDEEHSSMESGPSWVVKLNKSDFIGKNALAAQQNGNLKRKLSAFKLTERGIPRHGSKIICDGKEVGIVTSGTFSPILQCGIAMGYIPANCSGSFAIECHGKNVPAVLTTVPFYKKNKCSCSIY